MKPVRICLGLLLACAIGAAAITGAKDVWEDKPYREWTAADCAKVLTNSPWARQRIVSRVMIESLSAAPSDRGRESNPWITYTIQFRSAQPVRQAMVRLEQIAKRYDKLDAENKAVFDKSTDVFLSQSFPGQIIVLVEYSTNVQSYKTDMNRDWSTRTDAWAKNEIFLINGRGEKVPPLRFTVRQTGGGFQIVFPRLLKNESFVNASDKELSLEFPHPTIGVLQAERVLEVFKVAKMVVDGKVEH